MPICILILTESLGFLSILRPSGVAASTHVSQLRYLPRQTLWWLNLLLVDFLPSQYPAHARHFSTPFSSGVPDTLTGEGDIQCMGFGTGKRDGFVSFPSSYRTQKTKNVRHSFGIT